MHIPFQIGICAGQALHVPSQRANPQLFVAQLLLQSLAFLLKSFKLHISTRSDAQGVCQQLLPSIPKRQCTLWLPKETKCDSDQGAAERIIIINLQNKTDEINGRSLVPPLWGVHASSSSAK